MWRSCALLNDPRLLILDEPVGADAAGGGKASSSSCASWRRRRLQHPLHQPQARRDPRAVPPVHRAARRPVTGAVDRRKRPCRSVAPDDRRAEPPQLATTANHAWRRGARGAPADAAADDQFGTRIRHRLRSTCAPARCSASPASRQTVSGSCWRRCRARTRAPARLIRAVPARTSPCVATAPPRGPAPRARGAPGTRRGADDEPGAEHAADPHQSRGSGASATDEVRKLAKAESTPLQRQGRGPARPRACPAATCRSSSSAARSTPGRGC